MPAVLYGCETWSLTLTEELTLRVFENRVLRRIFEPKRDEVTGEWRELHNEEPNCLYCSPTIVRVIKNRTMKWAGHVVWGRGEVYTGIWWGKLRERDHLGDPSVRWEYNIKMNLKEVGRGVMDGFELAEDTDRWWALGNVVMNLRIP